MKTSKFRPIHLLGPLLCLLPLGFSALQDPKPKAGPQEEEIFSDSDFFGSNRQTVRGGSIARNMQGCWKLASIKADDYPSRGIDLLGYLLISGSFMSLEVQAFWDDTLEDPPEDAFETFIGEVNTAGKGAMEVRILMGSFMDRQEGSLEWYQSERPERFSMTLPDNETLIMEWRGKRQMIFRRYRSKSESSSDFFGAADKASADDFYDDANDPIEKPEPIEDDDERPQEDPFD